MADAGPLPPSKKVLLVEGQDDKHVIRHLCARRQPTPNLEVLDKGGVNNLKISKGFCRSCRPVWAESGQESQQRLRRVRGDWRIGKVPFVARDNALRVGVAVNSGWSADVMAAKYSATICDRDLPTFLAYCLAPQINRSSSRNVSFVFIGI